MDAIFKALNDPARREILDRLRQKDGQSLSDLEEAFDMTRFGVMKHLKVLEEASLIVTRKQGRFKYHYLNALPLQEVIDRWIDPFRAKPTARAVLDLKSNLEGTAPMLDETEKSDFMMATFINCTHDDLWDALVQGDLIAKYHFISTEVLGNYEDGDTVEMKTPDGAPMLTNRVISVSPKSRIEMGFTPHWGPDMGESRAVYIVEPQASGMKLTVEHYGLGPGQEGIHDGWARFLSGLKTYLETGGTHRFAPEGMGA